MEVGFQIAKDGFEGKQIGLEAGFGGKKAIVEGSDEVTAAAQTITYGDRRV